MKYLLCLTLFFGLLACHGTQRAVRSTDIANNATIDDRQISSPIDLTDFIRRLSGVTVNGDGPSARILVRGIISIQASNDPLFVVNGTNVGTDYGAVYSTISADQVKSVEVLKDAADIGVYGMQGAAGVIVIQTK